MQPTKKCSGHQDIPKTQICDPDVYWSLDSSHALEMERRKQFILHQKSIYCTATISKAVHLFKINHLVHKSSLHLQGQVLFDIGASSVIPSDSNVRNGFFIIASHKASCPFCTTRSMKKPFPSRAGERRLSGTKEKLNEWHGRHLTAQGLQRRTLWVLLQNFPHRF